ncbi:MAG: nucleotidyltransferase family protein [Chloroflexi bacterium]|nr:nucleotidyltransferase family protein [Chloroflexota bacterium]
MGIDSGTQFEASDMAATTTIRTLDDIRRLRPQIMELARQYRARKVSVFGSCARGEMSEDSDIDFLVDFNDNYRLLDIAGMMNGLEDLLGRKVDVVPRSALREELKPYVLKEVQPL